MTSVTRFCTCTDLSRGRRKKSETSKWWWWGREVGGEERRGGARLPEPLKIPGIQLMWPESKYNSTFKKEPTTSKASSLRLR